MPPVKQPPRPKDGSKVPKCKACGDSGKDSKGRPCTPCVMNGRIK